MSLRSTPSKTPPPDVAATLVTPASGTSKKRKKKTLTGRKKSARKEKVAKTLEKSFDEDGDGSDTSEPDASKQGARGGKSPPARPGPAPAKQPPSALDALEASDNPLMKLVAQQFRAERAENDALRNELLAVKREADARQAVRDFDEGGISSFHFDPRATQQAISTFVVPNVRVESVRQFFQQLQVTPSTQDSVTRAFSSVVSLTKSVRNKIFQRRQRDSYLSTKPRPLSEGERQHYSKEQLAKDKVLSQMHEDFSPVLQVLYHLLHLLSDGFDPNNCDDDEYINHWDELEFVSEDLAKMLLEYYGKHIAGPRRDLFEKVTGLPVNPGKASQGFLTEPEAEAAMLVAQQQDLIQQHISAVAPRFQSTSQGRGRGGGKGGGANRRPGNLRAYRQQQNQRGGRPQQSQPQRQPQQQQQQQQQSSQQQQQQQQQPPQPPAAAGTPAKPFGQKKSTTPGSKNRGGGKGK